MFSLQRKVWMLLVSEMVHVKSCGRAVVTCSMDTVLFIELLGGPLHVFRLRRMTTYSISVDQSLQRDPRWVSPRELYAEPVQNAQRKKGTTPRKAQSALCSTIVTKHSAPGTTRDKCTSPTAQNALCSSVSQTIQSQGRS